MWIEVHDTLPDHQKVACVSDALGVSETQVIGMLVCIWTWALSNRPEGKLSNVDKRIVERAARWEGVPGELFAALLDAAWIDYNEDDTYEIHDWGDYAGRLIEKRAQAVARAQKSRERCAHVARNVRERCAYTVPNLTVPNQTKETPPSESSNELSSPQWEAVKAKKSVESVLAGWEADETVKTAMAEFVAMRKTLRKPMTPRAVELAIGSLRKLAGDDAERAVAIINQSIERSWQGLFDLQDGTTQKQARKEEVHYERL